MAKGPHRQPTRRVHQTAGRPGNRVGLADQECSTIGKEVQDLSWDQAVKVAVKEVGLLVIENTMESVVAVGEITLLIRHHVEVMVETNLQV